MVKVVGAKELPMVVFGEGHQSTAALGRYHGEIATSQLCAAVVHGDRGQLAVLLCELSDRVGAISCGVDAY